MVAFRGSKVGKWFERNTFMVALMVALVLVALLVPSGLAGAQATPVDPTVANVNAAVAELTVGQYITAGLFLGLVFYAVFRLLRAKRA